MDPLTAQQRQTLAGAMQQRTEVLRDEIRRGLAHMGSEAYAELLGGTSDAGDESVATLLRDLRSSEVARDVTELRDILAAQARVTAGTYGKCIDCGAPIPYARLEAHPTAKRCLACQEIREATRAPLR